MQILSVSGLLAGISATLFDALIALGEPRGVFKISVVSVALLAAGLPPAILRAGLVGAAVVVDSISVVSMVFALWLVGNRLGLRSTSLVRPLAKPLASAALTVPILFPLEQALGLGLAEFFVLVGGYSFLYGALLSIVTRGSAIKEALSLVRLVLARRGPE